MFNAKQKLFLIALHLCVLPLIPPTSRSQNMTGEKENDRDKVNLSFETKSPPPAVLKPQTNPTLAEYRKRALLQKLPKFLNCGQLFDNRPRWQPKKDADRVQGFFGFHVRI